MESNLHTASFHNSSLILKVTMNYNELINDSGRHPVKSFVWPPEAELWRGWRCVYNSERAQCSPVKELQHKWTRARGCFVPPFLFLPETVSENLSRDTRPLCEFYLFRCYKTAYMEWMKELFMPWGGNFMIAGNWGFINHIIWDPGLPWVLSLTSLDQQSLAWSLNKIFHLTPIMHSHC